MEKKFIDGMRVEKAHENAPSFVKCKGSFKKNDLISWLQNQEGDWINWQIKESQKGNLYAEVDTWEPKEKPDMTPQQVSEVINQGQNDDLPF